ncbi:ribonuclease III [Candidatus Shapirobacteria bacterium CG08_land_8_20_14_0_20_39_18]|uniref:Ribonuclease 3 n=1 Tax=Candidatus Shapirobacteria bacterium CG08_land_8_20_14_0_20_39_18 TaxID=1974883 RepID=A0A2M6XD47_9BACT|nr:MAG: ribonuclease III [Candidatus Shapirobacteria bacterium CG08_land_8_20_14_0_20_39_18]PIY66128.1 MAG: ribonuclease III [Candidatus Shapirobacteria bacterium CG_4_10_14_0_8_um_filter_39_15]PJE68515.1 MAG: ribonuclease III [Candidatus Shapirobacteria bacterium CG10_big_fil_rev_8_21_14_0_10_38_8]
MDNKELEKKLFYAFDHSDLLFRALTHRSYLNEHQDKKLQSNERLEYLGDAVLELLISRKIYEDYPDLPEGDLTALRAKIVCTKTLSEIAKELELGKFLLLSRGEDEGGGRDNQTLLANCLEAIIGAVYLDQGFEAADKFVKKHFLPKIPVILGNNLKDAKSLFQEIVQEKEKVTPNYKVIQEVGPDHAKIFTVGVFLDKKKVAQAEGRSKQEAEENAAQAALELIK